MKGGCFVEGIGLGGGGVWGDRFELIEILGGSILIPYV